MKTALYLAASSIALFTAPAAAHAQQASGGGVEEIVVTAQKRSENLQDVPVAITAVTAARLEATGITNVSDIGIVTPSLALTEFAGTLQPHIRGVGTSFSGPGVENPIAMYIDGVYIANGTSSLMTLNNIERVEVLKGPQGTLFGRNATGGLINVITKDPKYDPSMALDLSYANYQTVTASAYVSSGITDNVAADLAIRYDHQGKGWGRNLFTGNDTNVTDHDFSVRSKLLLEPGDATRIRLTADYADRKGVTSQGHVPGYPANFNNAFFGGPYDLGGPYDVNTDVDYHQRLQTGGVGLQINQDLGSVAFQSITAYRKTKFSFDLDLDLTPQPLIGVFVNVSARQLSQEFQLSSTGNGPLKWVTGVYLFSAKDQYDPTDIILDPHITGTVPIQRVLDSITRTRSAAIYGQASYEIVDGTTLTLGGRYTYEDKRLGGTESVLSGATVLSSYPLPAPGSGIPPKISYKRFNYRIALDHKVTPDILAYVSYNTGFKSGGYNLDSAASNPPYKPETIKAAEAGLKMQLFDRHLRFNIAAFHYRYSNLQVASLGIGTTVITNAASAKIYGFDFDAELILAEGLSLSGGLGYVHDRFGSYPNAPYYDGFNGCTAGPGQFCQLSAKGNKLGQSPTLTYNVGANYKTQVDFGALDFNILYSYSSRYYASPDNYAFQPGYGLLNASVQWTDRKDHLSFRLWGKNLTNKVYAASIAEANQGVFRHLAAPRTYGVTLGVKF